MSRNVFWIQQEGGSCYQIQSVSLCFLLVYWNHWYWEISMRIVYWFLLTYPCGAGVAVWSSICALFWLEPPLRSWVLFSWVCLYMLLHLLPCSFLKPFVLLFCRFSVWLLCVLGSVFPSLVHLVSCIPSYCLIGTCSFGLRKILLHFAWKYCLCLWPGILPLPLILLFVDLVFSWYLRFIGCFLPGFLKVEHSLGWGVHFFCFVLLPESLPSTTRCWWGLPLRVLSDFLRFSLQFFFSSAWALFSDSISTFTSWAFSSVSFHFFAFS